MAWISDRRLYLTDDDHVVEDGDPRAARLLVGAGGVLDDATAERYGLTGAKQKATPADNKLKRPPGENKGR
jgi:hypothetical protein